MTHPLGPQFARFQRLARGTSANDDPNERASIVARARKLRADIQQAFDDAAHWNHMHPECIPIDPDPDGQLARVRDGLDRMLVAEPGA